jgi:hypothetical protein
MVDEPGSDPFEQPDQPQGRPEAHDSMETPTVSDSLTAVVNLLKYGVSRIPNFFAEFGWPMLFTMLILYIAWPHVENMRQKVSLAVANNPVRKETFDTERKRARAMQQLDVYKAHRQSRDAEAGSANCDDEVSPSEDEGT